jgi:hypothetical protein
MKEAKRLCIYPKDIALITGKSERHGRRILERIRLELNKDSNHLVTIEEFCNHTGLEIKKVGEFIL